MSDSTSADRDPDVPNESDNRGPAVTGPHDGGPQDGSATDSGNAVPADEPEPQEADAETQPEPRRPLVGRFVTYLGTANSVMVTVYSFILAMIIGGILIIISDEDTRGTFAYFFSRPTDALEASWTAVSEAYAGLFRGSIIDFDTLSEWLNGSTTLSAVLDPISETLTYAAPLILAGLAVGLAFRAGLFNIGAEGQVIMGAVGAGVVGFSLNLPAVIHLPLVLLAGAAAGAIFGAIPGVLKARTGAHEVITSIMLNYVALNFLGWLVHLSWVENNETPKVPDQSRKLAESARIPQILGSDLRVNLSILLAIAAGVVVWWLLSKSTLGYRMRAVGLNPDASRTAGMSVPRTFMASMAAAGALAGLGGAVAVGGMGLPYALSNNVSAGIGFDGITVALLGRAKPGGVIAAGLLFGALRAGTSLMQPDVPIDMVLVLQAIIVIFIAAPALVKAMLRLRMPTGGLATTTAKGW